MKALSSSLVRVGIIDDHVFIAKGLELLLEDREELSMAWSATDVEVGLGKLVSDPVDVLVLDMKLESAVEGLAALRMISELAPAVQTIVLSAYAQPRTVREAYRLGARGYFCKGDAATELLDSLVDAVKSSDIPFYGPYKHLARPSRFVDVSPRETEVLFAVAKGASNPLIGKQLGMSVGTVKAHLESIYRKLGVNCRVDAARVAMAEGYFSLEEVS